MNYIIYAKHKNDKRFGAMNLRDGTVGVGLMFATLISDVERAKEYRDDGIHSCPDFDFQVRVAGTNKVIT